MAPERAELRKMTDDELIAAYRHYKDETAGQDPELTPPAESSESDIRDEMERRGLAPDREDVIPDHESVEEEPVVEDRA